MKRPSLLGRVRVGALVVLAIACLLWVVFGAAGGRNDRDEGARAAAPIERERSSELLAVSPRDGSDNSGRAELLDVEGDFGFRGLGVRLSGAGKLEGRVVERGTGLGVPGVHVELWPFPPVGQNLFGRFMRMSQSGSDFISRASAVARVESGVDGQFQFARVREGRYFLDASGPQHVAEGTRGVLVAASGHGGPIDVHVRAGGRVMGQLVDADGQGIGGAKVALFQGLASAITAARRGDLRYRDTFTTADGGFVFGGVGTDSVYELSAMGRGFALTHVVGIAPQVGETTELTVQASVGGIVRGKVLVAQSGEERDILKPAAGATVSALPRGLRDLHFSEEVFAQCQAKTASDGTYELRFVPRGDVDLMVAGAEFVPIAGTVVEVEEGQVSVAGDIVVEQGRFLSGRVVDGAGAPLAGATVRWVGLDTDDFNFSIAPLLAKAAPGSEFPVTDGEGVYRLGPIGDVIPNRIVAHRSGYLSNSLSLSRYSELDDEDVLPDLVLRRGDCAIEGIVMNSAEAEPVERFRISSEYLVESEPGAPAGMNPFSGGRIVESPDGKFGIDGLVSSKSNKVDGDDGSTGEIWLRFEAEGFLPATVVVKDVEPGGTKRGVIVRMVPGGTVRGTVVDIESAPVAGARVFVQSGPGLSSLDVGPEASELHLGLRLGQEADPGFAAGLGLLQDPWTIAEEDGSFELLGVPPGAQRVMASHPDYPLAQSEEISVVEGGEMEDVTVRFVRGSTLFGDVTDRRGRAVEGALILAASPNGMWKGQGGSLYQGVSDSRGAYRIEAMLAGSYFVIASRGDESLNLMSFLGTLNFDLVTLPPELEVRFDVVDGSADACRVYGTIRERGEPVGAGALLAFGFESEGLLGLDAKVARVDSRGNYEFEGLAPGEYRLTFNSSDFEGTFDIDVPDQAEVRMDLELPDVSVFGKVVDASTGEPIVNAGVTLKGEFDSDSAGLLAQILLSEGNTERDYTGKDGRFEFRHVRPGSYEVQVMGPRWGDRRGDYGSSEILRVEADVGLSPELEIALEPSLYFKGIARGVDGQPVGDVYVSLEEVAGLGGWSRGTASDESGQFTVRGLSPGGYRLTARASDYAESRAFLELDETPVSDYELTLYRGVDVTVWVTGSGGEPALGAVAEMVPETAPAATGAGKAKALLEGLFESGRASDTDGKLSLGRVAPGTYRLEVSRGRQSVVTEGVRVVEGTPGLEIRVRLP